MSQTIKTVAHAPMKLSEPLLVGTLVMLLIGFNVAAGSRTVTPYSAPAHQVSSIDE